MKIVGIKPEIYAKEMFKRSAELRGAADLGDYSLRVHHDG